MPSPLQTIDPDAVRHTALEDVQGLATSLTLCAVGMTILAHLGLITGQTAGLALLISYATGWNFGVVFVVINIPFYAFAWRKLGTQFTLKSFACVVVLSLMMEVIPGWMPLGDINPLFGVVAFGAMTGVGLLGIVRHKGSLGGLGAVALIVQDTTGFRAGYVQLIFDAVLFGVALLFLPPGIVAYSLAGAVILNGVIAFNHRRDRYIAP